LKAAADEAFIAKEGLSSVHCCGFAEKIIVFLSEEKENNHSKGKSGVDKFV
jgi:hypothetical protein